VLVLILIVLLLLLWVILALLLTGWSLWFQGFLYTEPARGIVWRGPAAASAIMLVVLVWVVLVYHSPGRFQPLWEAASTEKVKQFDQLRVPVGNKEEVFYLRPGGKYRDRNNRPLPSTPSRVIVVEDDHRYTFEPERDENGNFKRHLAGGRVTEPLRYFDEKGRVMTEGEGLGRIESFRSGRFIGNLLLNLAFLASVFLGLWLLLRFQWLHALGQAVALSLLLLLFVMPQLASKTEKVAHERATARSSHLIEQGGGPFLRGAGQKSLACLLLFCSDRGCVPVAEQKADARIAARA
jgi:hypothetical protein